MFGFLAFPFLCSIMRSSAGSPDGGLSSQQPTLPTGPHQFLQLCRECQMPKVGQVLVKRCIECGVEKPVAEFWKHRSTVDGYFNRCRTCAAPRSGPNATVRDEPGEGFKYCPRCKQTLPKNDFHRNRNGSQNYCKEC